MTEDEAKSLFSVAGFNVTGAHELMNQYWPRAEDYYEVIVKSPWWLMMTEIGPVRIGWRKRVISIEWEGCSFGTMPVRGIVTEDDVTKTETLVHAYSKVKAAEYLAALRHIALGAKKHGIA